MRQTLCNPADSTGSTPRKRSRVGWGLFLTFIVAPVVIVATAGLVLGIAWNIREAQGRKAMQVELARLEDEKISTTCEGLSHSYGEQTTDEFAEDWEVLFHALRSFEFEESKRGVPDFDPALEVESFEENFDISAQWKDAENSVRFVEDNQKWITLARRLASEPKPNRFPLVFQSIETKLQEVQDTRTLACMLRLDAQVAMHLHDSQRAFEDTVAMVELSKHVDAVPCAISRVVGISFRKMALEALQKAIAVDLYDDSKLHQLDQLFGKYTDIGHRWKTIMQDELSGLLPVFSDPDLGKKVKREIPARGHDAVYFIGLMRMAMAIPTDDWEALYSGTIGLENELRMSTKSKFKKFDIIMTSLLMPSLRGLAVALINEAQSIRQARMAIAIRLYQHEHGRLPSSLEMLPKSTVSLRPYGELPFGYEASESRAVLWGFVFSESQRQTPQHVPDISQENAESINNRHVVWDLGVGQGDN